MREIRQLDNFVQIKLYAIISCSAEGVISFLVSVEGTSLFEKFWEFLTMGC